MQGCVLYCKENTGVGGTRGWVEIAQWLRARTTLSKNLDSIPTTNMVAHDHLEPSSRSARALLWPLWAQAHRLDTDIQAKHLYSWKEGRADGQTDRAGALLMKAWILIPAPHKLGLVVHIYQKFKIIVKYIHRTSLWPAWATGD